MKSSWTQVLPEVQENNFFKPSILSILTWILQSFMQRAESPVSPFSPPKAHPVSKKLKLCIIMDPFRQNKEQAKRANKLQKIKKTINATAASDKSIRSIKSTKSIKSAIYKSIISKPTTTKVTKPEKESKPKINPEVVVHDPVLPPETEVVHVKRGTWGSTLGYLLTLLGYSVGFGNLWRFPYLVRECGGVVFLIPYMIMLVLVGTPVFFLELAVGQRRRKGLVYAWNEVSPMLGGLGICCASLCLLINFYYNTLIAYCISYFIDSFENPLPWSSCEKVGEAKDVADCNKYSIGKESKFYFYRETLDVSSDIDSLGNFNALLLIYHVIVWVIIWLIMCTGTKLIEKVVYVTSIFPYAVLILFFIANCAIQPGKGWLGAYRLLQPDWSRLWEPLTWLKAGSQIFFSLGLGEGGLVVLASYSPVRHNCYMDAIRISLMDCGSSIFAALVVFPMIGALGYRNYENCFSDMKQIFPTMEASVHEHYDIYFTTKAQTWENISLTTPIHIRYAFGEMTDDEKANFNKFRFEEKIQAITDLSKINKPNNQSVHLTLRDCSIGKEATASGGGTGFVFLGFTEAVTHLPWPNLWSILFFLMLGMLGLDTAFASVEATSAALQDLTKLDPVVAKIITGITMTLVSTLLFSFGFGIYILDLLDQYSANWTLLVIALAECIAVAWVYGLAKIAYDVRLMTGKKPSLYILVCWKYICPVVIILLLLGSVIQFIIDAKEEGGIFYTAFQPENSKSGDVRLPLPAHSLVIGFLLMFLCLSWLPIQAVLRNTKYNLIRGQEYDDFPEQELRLERNINVVKEEEQFTQQEKIIIGQGSLDDLQRYRDKTKDAASESQISFAVSGTSSTKQWPG